MTTDAALFRLHTMGDWLELQSFDQAAIMQDLAEYSSDWKPYNQRKPNNRWGLSVTSLDGDVSGIPDLDSLSEYNRKYGTAITNHDINQYTKVYDSSSELQRVIAPWKPWLGRCHFLKLNSGGFFPEHYDLNKLDFSYEDTRLIGFVNNTDKYTMKFLYEDRLLDVKDGTLYWFNASKRHSVFSMTDDCIMIVFCLKFDQELYNTIINQYRIE